MVVDDFKMEDIRTKEFAQMLENLKLTDSSVLMLLPENDYNIYLSSRNLSGVNVYSYDRISAYDILKHKKILLMKGAVEKIQNYFNNN